MPMTNARMIDEKEVLDIIDQLRTTIPEEVRAAKQIQQQRDRVMAQGKEEANRMVDLARQHSSTFGVTCRMSCAIQLPDGWASLTCLILSLSIDPSQVYAAF